MELTPDVTEPLIKNCSTAMHTLPNEVIHWETRVEGQNGTTFGYTPVLSYRLISAIIAWTHFRCPRAFTQDLSNGVAPRAQRKRYHGRPGKRDLECLFIFRERQSEGFPETRVRSNERWVIKKERAIHGEKSNTPRVLKARRVLR